MKKGFVLSLCILLVVSSINATNFEHYEDKIGVTFATNSNIKNIRYYFDSAHAVSIDSTSRIEMEPGSSIFIDYNNPSTSFYDFLGFKLYFYDDNGQRQEEPVWVHDVNEIKIPTNFYYTEISIEPYGEFRERHLTFSDTVDGIETNNEWMINEDSYTGVDTASINAAVPYSISFKYDSDRYYIESINPDNRVIFAGSGMVVFFEENPQAKTRMKNLVSDYSVQLKPYTHVFFTEENRKKQVNGIFLNGQEIEISELAECTFEIGDSFIIETDRDWILTGDGVRISQNNLTSESRVYSVTILDSKDYDIYLALEESKVFSVAFDLPEIRERESIPDFQISFSDENYTGYNDVLKKRAIDLEAGEKLYLHVRNIEPTRERMKLVFEFEDGHKEESGYIRGVYDEEFTFSDISGANLKSIECKIDYGFYFPELIENDSNIDVDYYIENGDRIKGGDFLEDGTPVVITVKNCPLDRQLTTSANVEEFDDGVFKVVISGNTLAKDFAVQTKPKQGFWFDPLDYEYEHGTIEFEVGGVEIDSARFIENGKIISYKERFAETGFVLHSGEVEVSGAFTENKLRDIRFVEDELITILLNQPEFGGRIIYKDSDGNEISGSLFTAIEGDEITLEFEADEGYQLASGVSNSYKVNSNKEQSLPEIKYPFAELDSHKPELKLRIDSAPSEILINGKIEDIVDGKLERFDLNVSEKILNSASNEFDDRISVYKALWKKVGVIVTSVCTHKPIELKVSGVMFDDSDHQALKITRIDKMSNGDEFETETYCSKANFEYEISFNEKPSHYESVELVFATVDGYYHDSKSLRNAKLSLICNGEELQSDDFIEHDAEVEIRIIPDAGYYLEGDSVNEEGKYSKTMKYSRYINDIDKIIKDHPVKKYVSLTLPEREIFGVYSYEYDGDQVNPGLYSKFKDDTTLSIVFSVIDGYELKRIPFLDKKSIEVKVDITSDMDGASLEFEDLDITVREVTE